MSRPLGSKNKVSPEKVIQPAFKVTFSMGDRISEQDAEDIPTALKQLAPESFKGKGIFKIQRGKQQSETYLYPRQMRRLFINSISQQLFAKRMTNALK